MAKRQKCGTCGGKGVVPNPAREEANGAPIPPARRGQISCPDCGGRVTVRAEDEEGED